MSSSHGTSGCIDAGSQFCPCVLADLGECIACSLLKGEDMCDCSWPGVCIYSEYLWAGKRSLPPRPEFALPIVEARRESKALVILTLDLPENLSRDMAPPGAFLFLRPPGTRQCFNTPVSIMDLDGGKARFALQIIGPKTRALERAQGSILARGPYWSGIWGVERLKRLRNSRALIVARGVSQGPALHVARWLASAGNAVKVAFIPGEAVDAAFISSDLERMGIPLVGIDPGNSRPAEAIAGLAEGAGLVHSSGPDAQHRLVSAAIRSVNPAPKLTASNNSVMCCGDGVCGSCGVATNTNQWTRACKASVNPEDVALSIEEERRL